MRIPAPIRYLDEVNEHIKEHFGTDFFVLHEEKSATIHVDIHVVKPTSPKPFFTLLTSGMSDLDMTVPEDFEDWALAELCLCLPPTWPLGMTNCGWREPKYSWPIRILQQAARYPHMHRTWLGWGHSVPLVPSDGADPEEARFKGTVFLRPQTFPESAGEVATADGRTIRYLAVIPLLPPELTYKQSLGIETFAERLFASGVTELLDPHRPSVVKPS